MSDFLRRIFLSYKFATENLNYEDYASGRVLYNQKGTTSFPARLASEIYQRCVAVLEERGNKDAFVIYDPCCGGAYLLTILGFLHGEKISHIYGSDIDKTAISLAQRNLSLLSPEGINQRIMQIEKMTSQYGKESHSEALKSALKLKDILERRKESIEITCFMNDITGKLNIDSDTIYKINYYSINNFENINNKITREIKIKNIVNNVNILITDLPYGNIVNWRGMQNEDEAIKKMLDNVLPILARNSVISIVSGKKTKIKHDSFRRVDKFAIGKRQITILVPGTA